MRSTVVEWRPVCMVGGVEQALLTINYSNVCVLPKKPNSAPLYYSRGNNMQNMYAIFSHGFKLFQR